MVKLAKSMVAFTNIKYNDTNLWKCFRPQCWSVKPNGFFYWQSTIFYHSASDIMSTVKDVLIHGDALAAPFNYPEPTHIFVDKLHCENVHSLFRKNSRFQLIGSTCSLMIRLAPFISCLKPKPICLFRWTVVVKNSFSFIFQPVKWKRATASLSHTPSLSPVRTQASTAWTALDGFGAGEAQSTPPFSSTLCEHFTVYEMLTLNPDNGHPPQ